MKRSALLIVGVVLAAGAGAGFYRLQRAKVPEPAPASARPSSAPAPSAPPEPEPSSAPVASPSAALELPRDAPKSVRFGVILIQYAGAELVTGAAIPKSEAVSRAQTLAREAQQNFDEAVKKGDKGSTTDAGSMPRGVLEPALEYALFTLKKGEVTAAPLDTPRGFWILRRNE